MLSPFFTQNEESLGFLSQLAEFMAPETLLSWEFWAILSVVLLVAEVITAGFLVGAFVPGTALATLLAALGLGMEAQLWGFVGGTLVGLFFLRPIWVKKAQAGGEPSNVDALVGQKATVTEAITVGGIGRVRIRSEEWRAHSETPLDAGALVRVTCVEGNSVTVESAQ
ncbi:MAG: NfeD family protein [Planctomycetota bacterium]|nr:NfeD family protein [Planctomycetota bacterium]